MHFAQKRIINKAFNCGEVLQLTFLTKKEYQLLYYRAKVEVGTSTKKHQSKRCICYRLYYAHKIYPRIVSDHMRIFSNKRQCAH